MMLCLVTDRKRLAGAGVSLDAARACLLRQTACAVEAGVDLVQLREPDLEGGALAFIARELRKVTRGSRTRLVVNDRLDVALASGADGVHLRASSIAVAAARRIAPSGFLVGRSVHSIDEAAAAAEADYLIAGTVFPSASKPGALLLGVDGLKRIADSVEKPVLAIGGIADAHVEAVARAGAAGCAGIGLFMAGETAAAPCRAMPLQERIRTLRSRFDAVRLAVK